MKEEMLTSEAVDSRYSTAVEYHLTCISCHSINVAQEPDGGTMKGLAFAYDPDGYSIEIVPRGGIEYGDVKAK